MTTLIQKSFQYLNSDDKVYTKLLPVAFHRRSGYLIYYERNTRNLCLYSIDQATRRWSYRCTWEATLFSSINGVFPIEFLDCFAVLGDSKNGSYVIFLDFHANAIATFPFYNEGGIRCSEYSQQSREFLISTVSGDIICLFLKIDKSSRLHVSRKKLFRIKTPELHVAKQLAVFDLTNQYLVLSDKQALFCIDALTYEVIYSTPAETFLLTPSRIIINKCGTDFLLLCKSPDGAKEQLEYWHPPSDYASNKNGIFSRCMIPMSAKFSDAYFETVGLSDRTKLICVFTVDKRMQLWTVSGDAHLSLESDLIINIPDSIWTQCHLRISEDRKDRFFTHGHLKKVINPQVLPISNFDKFEGPRRRCLLYLFALGSCSVFDIDFPRFSDQLITESFLQLERRVVGDHAKNYQHQFIPVHATLSPLNYLVDDNEEHDIANVMIESMGDDDEVSIMSESLAVALESLADLKNDSERHSGPYAENCLHPLQGGNVSELSSRLGTPSGKGINADLSIGPLEPTIKEESTFAFDDQSTASSIKRRQEAISQQQQIYIDQSHSLAVKTAGNLDIDHRVEPKIFFPATIFSGIPPSSKPDIIACIQPYGVVMNVDDSLSAFSTAGMRPFRTFFENPSRDLLPVKLLSFCYRLGLVVVVTEFRDCLVFDYGNPSSPPMKLTFPLRRTAVVNDFFTADVSIDLPSQPISKAVRAKIGANSGLENWIVVFLGDNEGYVHYGFCNFKTQLSKTSSFFAHQDPIKAVFSIGDVTRPQWKAMLSLDFQTGHPILGIDPSPSSCLVSVSVTGEVKCWLPSATGTRAAIMDNVLVVSNLHWRLSGLFVISPFSLQGRKGSLQDKPEEIRRSIQSVSLLPSNLTICVGFDNGEMEQWVLPGIIGMGNTVCSAQQCNWTSSLHSSCVTSIRSFVQSFASGLKTVNLPTDGDFDRVMTSLTSFVKVDRRSKFTAGLTFKEMKSLVQASSIVTCSKDNTMIIWGIEPVFDVYCSFARPYPCRRFYFAFAPHAGLCFTKDLLSPPISSQQIEETGWVVNMVGNGRIVPVLLETRREIFVPICSEDEIDSRKAITDDTFHVTSFDDDMVFDRYSSMTRHRKKVLQSMPVTVKVLKPSKVVAASRVVEDELEKDISIGNNFRLLSLELLQEWAKVKEKEAQSVVISEEQMKFSAEFGTSRHVPLKDISERPKSPNLSLEQLLSEKLKSVESSTKQAVLHPGAVVLGIDTLPLNNDIVSEKEHKIEQNGLFLVAREKASEAALRTMIIDKHHQMRYVLDKSRSSSPAGKNIVQPLSSEAIINHFDDETDNVLHEHPIVVDSKLIITNHNDFVLDDSPDLTRAPTRSAETHMESTNQTDNKIVQNDLILKSSNTAALPDFSISNSLPKKITADSLTVKVGSMKPKYISKTSLDKLDTRELVKPITKDFKSVPVASLKQSKTGTNNELKIIPSKQTITQKLDFESGTVLVPVDAPVHEPKQEISLVLSIPSVHENDAQPPSAELFVPPQITVPIEPVAINRAMIPQKFILKKEKAQQPKLILPSKVKPTVTAPAPAPQKKKAAVAVTKSVPVVVEKKDKPLELQEDIETGEDAVEEYEPVVDTTIITKSARSSIRIADVAEPRSPTQMQMHIADEGVEPTKEPSIISAQQIQQLPLPSSLSQSVQQQEPPEFEQQHQQQQIQSTPKTQPSQSQQLQQQQLPQPQQTTQPVVAAVAAPVTAVTIDLPDQKDEWNKKRAILVAAQLQRKGLDVAPVINDGQEIRGYFDRNAKPIFVQQKEPIQKHRLIPKRLEANTHHMRDTYSEEDSEIISVIPIDDMSTGLHSPSNASIGTSQSRKSEGSTSKANTAQKVDQNIAFLNDLEGEEREMLDGLDDRLRDKLMAQLKKAKSGDIRLLKKITNKIIMESRILQMLKMDMAVDIIEVHDRSFRVSVATAYGGSMFVVLMKPTRSGKKPGKERFKTEMDIKTIPGYVEHHVVSVVKNGSQQVQFNNLHPSCHYWVYVAVDRTQAEVMASKEAVDMKEVTDTSPPVLLEVETTEENLDIEWGRMSLDMRVTELRAAIRCELIQIRTRFHFPVLVIPSDNEIFNEDTLVFLDPSKSIEDKLIAKDKLSKPLFDFLDWWVGDETLGTRIRGEFHQYEVMQMILKGDSLRKFISEGFIDNEDVDVLTKYSLFFLKENYDKYKCHRNMEPEVPHPLLQGKFSDVQREEGLKLFKRFRSWYKGGVVVEDYQEQTKKQLDEILRGNVEFKMEDSVSLSDRSDSTIVDRVAIPLTQQRLIERENCLLDLIDNHDKCSDMVKNLGRLYLYVLEKKLTEIMMIQDRGRIKDKDCTAIMGAKKLLTLAVDHMLYDETELNYVDNKPFPEVDILTIDPFMFIDLLSVNTPTTSKKPPEEYIIPEFVYFQRIGGFDIFSPVDIAKLTPDNPPPAHVKTLPGTNRHPIKAWQSMSKYDQEVEIALACSLDSIWDLAVEAGVEIPDPEDRILALDHFPERQRVWKAFREWYAGEEDTNPLPGQGIPTLARVIFSEQYELRQIEDDPIVVDSMKRNNLPLPNKFKEGELDMEMLAATFGSTRRNSQVKQRGSVVLPDEPGTSASSHSERKSGRKFRPQRQQSSLRKSVFLDDNIETMKQAYCQAMNTMAGKSVRQDMICMTLNKLLASKRMQTLKWLWPPGLNRVGLQYLMPRAGFAIPKFSLPEKRFYLFPKIAREAFNFHEISQWFSKNDLDQDDIAMQKAEAKGVKLRAYHEWLAHEPERVEQSRKDMLQEDDLGWQRREIEKILFARLARLQEKLVEMDDALDDDESELRTKLNSDYIEEQTKILEQLAEEQKRKRTEKRNIKKNTVTAEVDSTQKDVTGKEDEAMNVVLQENTEESIPFSTEEEQDELDGANDPNAPIPSHRKIDASFLAKKFFRFGLPLPKEYWYVFEESAEFKYGSGIYNDDEAEEIALEQRMSALKALEDAHNLEKYLNEEKKRRDEEEKARIRREEQDRRLKEGVLRRRQIRENLEEIKRQRVIKAAEEKARKEEQEITEKLERLHREEEERELARIQKIEDNRQKEMKLMYQEEVYVRDYKIRLRELRMMEHEDILSFLQEQIAVREEEKRQARIKELEELYTPFVPFEFKKSRILLPQLHAILRDEPDKEEVFLQEVLDSMTLSGSKNSSTTSRKISNAQLHYGNREYFARNKLQEHDTENSMRHRSKRYMSLFGDVKYHPEILHENPEAVAAEEARLAEEEKNWLYGMEEDDEDYGVEDYVDDNESKSVDNASHSESPSVHENGYNLEVETDVQLGALVLEDSPSKAPSSPVTLRFDVSGTTANPNDRELDGEDQNSVGQRSLSSTSSRSSRRRRRRPGSSPTKQILSPRTGNNLVQRSVDSFPTRDKIQKTAKEAQKRVKDSLDPTQLLSVNPYDGHWMLLQRPTPVLYSSAPVLVQPTYHGTGVEALTTSPPRSRQRASRLLRPLKKQLKKDLEMIHSATTSALPDVSTANNQNLHHAHSSPYLPTALSPLVLNDNIANLDAQELLRKYATTSGPQNSSIHEGSVHFESNAMTQSALLENDSFSMSQASSLFNAGGSHDGSARKKMKDLLALSSDMLGKNDPKSWMKLMKTQRALAIASLSTLEGGGVAKHLQKERQKLIDIGAKQFQSNSKTKKQETQDIPSSPPVSLLVKKEKPLVDVEFDLIDFKTLKLAQAASDTVERLQQQRERVREYVNSDAIAKDQFFLAASQPGIHEADAIALSPVAEKFRRDIVDKINQREQSELRQSQSAGVDNAIKGGEAFGLDEQEHNNVKQQQISKKCRAKQKLSFVQSLSTVTQSEKSAATEKPSSPLKVIPKPGPKAVGALFGSTMKIASKDKYHGLQGDSQDVVVTKEKQKNSKSSRKITSIGKNDRIFEAKNYSVDAPEPSPIVYRESSLASKPSTSSILQQQPSLSLEEGDDELISSMSILPLRSTTPSGNPSGVIASVSSPPPRTPNSPYQRSRSVRSVDLFIKTPRSARLAGEEIELEVKNTLQLLPPSNILNIDISDSVK